MLEPKEIEVNDIDGKPHKFVISKFPALAGREIVTQYPISAVPKLGDYNRNEELVLKAMKYAAVPKADGSRIQLSTKDLVDNHVPDFAVLMKLEMELIEYNTNFFSSGKISKIFEGLSETVRELITSTLTDSLGRLSQKEGQPSTNSEPSTP